MKLDALFFGAHPDDVELSCGGTVAKFTRARKKVGIIDLTAGELGTRGSKEIRSSESKSAGKALNISVRENLGIPDGNILNNPENRTKVITLIRKYSPTVIFIPYHNDRHPDHKNANSLVRESSFYSGLTKLNTYLNGQDQKPYRPVRNIYFMQTYGFEPSFIVDITDEFETKIKAIHCYSSQFYNPASKEPDTFISDKKFLEYLEARAVYYGFQIGVKYGEPFYVEERIKFDIKRILEA